MAKLTLLLFLVLPLFLLGCDDSAFNCSNGNLDLEASECPAEDIFKPRCNTYGCRSVDNPNDGFGFGLSRFDCEVIDCNTMSCVDIETLEVTEFTDITPFGPRQFTTLLDSDMDQDFECVLTVAN